VTSQQEELRLRVAALENQLREAKFEYQQSLPTFAPGQKVVMVLSGEVYHSRSTDRMVLVNYTDADGEELLIAVSPTQVRPAPEI
jgi:hypothetical protein